MIKIPKSFDELKQMVSDANVGEVINKVKSGINTATETVKSAADTISSAKPVGEVKEVFDNFAKAQQQQQECIKQLQQYISQLQTKIDGLEKNLAELQAATAKAVVEVQTPLATKPTEPNAAAASPTQEHSGSESSKTE